MKQLFVTMILAIGLVFFIILLDLIMGIDGHGIIRKAINPFQVMDKAEYIFLFLFILLFMISLLKTFLNEKQKSNPPSK